MTDDRRRPTPPDDLPESIVTVLDAHADDGHALRETIVYAQELLNALHEPASVVEPRDGEEILRMREYDDYTEVVKRFADEDDAYVYHVRREHHPRGEDHVHWTLIGRWEPGDDEETGDA